MKLTHCAAEFVATFLFVFVGLMSVAAGGLTGPLGPALAHGLGLALAISITAHISGGQVNPAVSIALWLTNKLSMGQALGNVAGQILGAIVAAFAVQWVAGSEGAQVAIGLPAVVEGVTLVKAIFLEAVLTFFLVLVVFGTMVDSRSPKINGLYVGLTVVVAALTIGHVTGACLNPARYLGPAVAAGDFKDIVLYLAGPILGGAVGALVYTYGIAKPEPAATA